MTDAMATPSNDRSAAETAADAFLAAWTSGDLESAGEVLDPAFIFWSNVHQAGLRRDAAGRYARDLSARARGRRYSEVRRMATPGGLAQQHVVSFDSDAGAFSVPELLFFEMKDGRILRCDHYSDRSGLPDLGWPEDADTGIATPAGSAAGERAGDASIAVVRTYCDAWAARDLDGMRAATSDDYVQWHSHIRKDFSKAEEFALLEDALKVMRFNFHHVRLYPVEGGAIQQSLGDIALSNGAEARNVPFAMVYRTRDGKIVRCDEYVDGASLPQLDFIPAV